MEIVRSIVLVGLLLIACAHAIQGKHMFELEARARGAIPRHAAYAGQELVQVMTESGIVEGFMDGGLEKYFGIPYAEPPVGELRFRAPVPARPWFDRMLNATVPSAVCIQMMDTPVADPELESEDCLYLNVYTPSDVRQKQLQVPVLFWIHGGGFLGGAAREYDASSMLNISKTPVVVVTINYRLGSLGYFTLEGDDANVNAGIKDQQLALRWVQENIAQFGGDPERVTIFGESAGGSSVTLHMAMESSWPLFNNAIAESAGFDLPPLADMQAQSLKIAARAGCDEASSTEEMLDCLSRADLVDVKGPLYPSANTPEQPDDLAAAFYLGKVKDTNFLMGVVELEGRFLTDAMFGQEGEVSDKAYTIFSNTFFPEESRQMVREAYAPMRRQYGNRAALDHAIGDYMFCGWYLAQNGTYSTKHSWYQYVFTQREPATGRIPTHFAEVHYVFGNRAYMNGNPADEMLMEMIVNYWASFAVAGDPNVIPPQGVEWIENDPSPGTATILVLNEHQRHIAEFNSYFCGEWTTHYYGRSLDL